MSSPSSSTAQPAISSASSSTAQPKKRLVIYCNGTWNNSVSTDNPLTNVSRLSRCIEDIDAAGVLQIVYYHTGIGSGTSKFSNIIDGALGRGIDHNIKNIYTFICLNFSNPEDEIYLIGFSRGAYTARCLAAFIGTIGLLTKAGLVHINTLYDEWRKIVDADKLKDASFEPKLAEMDRDKHLRRKIDIEACAVWGTVSAIGLPRIFTDIGSIFMDMSGIRHILGLIPLPKPSLLVNKLAFIDDSIPGTLKNAFQALALNEMRTDFKPVFWANPPKTTLVKQCWFLGSHSDIGGGYLDAGLANLMLIWMIAQLRSHTKLGISNEALRTYLSPTVLSDPIAGQFGVHEGKERGKHNNTILTGKIHESLKGLFMLSGREPRTPGQTDGEKHRRPVVSPRTMLTAVTTSAFKITSRMVKNLKHEDGVPTEDQVQSNLASEPCGLLIKQSVHFSVRIMMAHKLNRCLLLEKRKTEIELLADARQQVIWRRSDFDGRIDKLEEWMMMNISQYHFLLEEKEIYEEKACKEEISLLKMWIHEWETAETEQRKTAKADNHEEVHETHLPEAEDRQDDGAKKVSASKIISGSDIEIMEPSILAEDDNNPRADRCDQVNTSHDDMNNQPVILEDQAETKKKKDTVGRKSTGLRKKKVSNPDLVTFLRPLLEEAENPREMYPRDEQATASKLNSG